MIPTFRPNHRQVRGLVEASLICACQCLLKTPVTLCSSTVYVEENQSFLLYN